MSQLLYKIDRNIEKFSSQLKELELEGNISKYSILKGVIQSLKDARVLYDKTSDEIKKRDLLHFMTTNSEALKVLPSIVIPDGIKELTVSTGEDNGLDLILDSGLA